MNDLCQQLSKLNLFNYFSALSIYSTCNSTEFCVNTVKFSMDLFVYLKVISLQITIFGHVVAAEGVEKVKGNIVLYNEGQLFSENIYCLF